ncbi:hypothetical protein [Micromonospora zhanjiangensis]|uniref:Uncharacterized protein n=1 Tax=Micromonospora zhanjiangensis TaxID=1522057 RepID=A0ABV8KFW8_9ACTN
MSARRLGRLLGAALVATVAVGVLLGDGDGGSGTSDGWEWQVYSAKYGWEWQQQLLPASGVTAMSPTSTVRPVHFGQFGQAV